MPVESDEDRAAFLDPDEFGTVVTYIAAGRPGLTLNGILDMPATRQMSGPGVEVVEPSFLVRSAALPDDAEPGAHTGDRLVLADGRRFMPRAAEPDGTGMTLLLLEEAEDEE